MDKLIDNDLLHAAGRLTTFRQMLQDAHDVITNAVKIEQNIGGYEELLQSVVKKLKERQAELDFMDKRVEDAKKATDEALVEIEKEHNKQIAQLNKQINDSKLKLQQAEDEWKRRWREEEDAHQARMAQLMAEITPLQEKITILKQDFAERKARAMSL